MHLYSVALQKFVAYDRQMKTNAANLKKEDPRVLFGRRLAELRKLQNLSQEDLAHKSGIARSYLSGVERGLRNISLLNICRLAETMDLAPAEFLKL